MLSHPPPAIALRKFGTSIRQLYEEPKNTFSPARKNAYSRTSPVARQFGPLLEPSPKVPASPMSRPFAISLVILSVNHVKSWGFCFPICLQFHFTQLSYIGIFISHWATANMDCDLAVQPVIYYPSSRILNRSYSINTLPRPMSLGLSQSLALNSSGSTLPVASRKSIFLSKRIFYVRVDGILFHPFPVNAGVFSRFSTCTYPLPFMN